MENESQRAKHWKPQITLKDLFLQIKIVSKFTYTL